MKPKRTNILGNKEQKELQKNFKRVESIEPNSTRLDSAFSRVASICRVLDSFSVFDGYIYEFRGSLSNLRNNLSELHRLGWTDQQTRHIQIQMSLYNPNVQLFTFVTLQNEFLSTGSIHFQSRFEPIHFYEFIFLDIKHLKRSGVFRESQGDSYVNLQQSVYLNDPLMYFNGFCCVFGTIKFLHLCRFNRRLSLFNETLRLSIKELISFSTMFSIIFTSFLCLFNL
ncbi:unnamed protein product [Rotaria sp. Silwood2]|nr:unnamed protein product [Rotaria sp. Silwood2]